LNGKIFVYCEEKMIKIKENLYLLISIFSIIVFSCSSQEYTTAKLAVQQQDLVKAAEWLPKAMSVEPGNPEIPVVLAVEVHANKNEWEKVKELFDLALSIDPQKTIEVRSSYLSVEETVNNYTEHYWANAFNSGVEQFQNIERDPDNKIKYLENAIKSFKNATLIKPGDANTYSTLAKCYFDYGDKDAAKNAALTAVERNPDSFDANFAAGQIIQRAGGSSDEILPLYKKAVSINPSHSRALRELASLYYDIGDKEESIQVFNNAIENEEDKIIQADLYFNLGVIHSQMKNFSSAENAFEEAIFLNEEDYEAAMGIATSYEGWGDGYLNGVEGFDKNPSEAARYYRKAEKRVKSLMMTDIDNSNKYKKQLERVRYKRDVAEGD
tara:strand:- start:812 stop:1960 length:1149 start_codon:yes stop_codon:yes gene_type:complete